MCSCEPCVGESKDHSHARRLTRTIDIWSDETRSSHEKRSCEHAVGEGLIFLCACSLNDNVDTYKAFCYCQHEGVHKLQTRFDIWSDDTPLSQLCDHAEGEGLIFLCACSSNDNVDT